VTSFFPSGIGKATKFFCLAIVSPMIFYWLLVSLCSVWTKIRKAGGGGDSYFDFCGHDGIISGSLLALLAALAAISILIAPISLLMDWRRWKKKQA
jgi:hypothetical protein